MIDNDIIALGDPLPRLVEAHALMDRKVSLVWANGSATTVDLEPVIASRRVFIPLRADDALFRTLRVSEYGDSIEWEGGIDFPADWLSRLPPVEFDNAHFRRIMDELDMSLDGMAAQLEISRRLVARYRKDTPIPRHIALATRYLAEHLGSRGRE
jgi:hypothetical protein